ncbi:hypothetical protein ASD04_05640 [Devosia sp. Root436]|uniref:hypothetical protein n=1 Tax=Devosia sp. Root436 TaxID=1736537 RepID=UPI0006F582BA|nr:hypothetical protein [Devosia sp. Root436]KQX40122.1 hypothetical protein ASD04_05640 [Devosia sp. Root436]
MIDNALQYLTDPIDRATLHDFLTLVLESGASDDKLADLWSGRSLLVYNKEAYRGLLTHTRDRLATSLLR